MPVLGLSNSKSRNQREDSRAESLHEKDDYEKDDYDKDDYDKDDYDKEYGAPDKQFEETGPDARLYRVYMKEAKAFDKNLVEENKDGVDVILVFAGLFSAVVTSFLIQASQSLQQNPAEVSSLLLYELVQIAQAGSVVANVTKFPNPNTKFTPDTISVWANGLWACSLVASLCVALFAVLVKQWLYHYESFSSGDARYRSHRRQYRYLGFERWGVTTITGVLPIIMHISLALFLIGLVLFYIPLLLPIAIAIAAITAVAFLLYFISNILPIFNPQCPYQTPLTQFLCFIIASTCQLISHIHLPFRGSTLLYFISNILPIFNPQCPYQTPLTQFLPLVISRTYGLLTYSLSFVLAYMYRLLLSTRWQFRRLYSRISVYLPITTSLWPWRKDNPVLPRNTANPVLGSVHRASSLTQQHINRFLCRISSVLQPKMFYVIEVAFHVVWSHVRNTRTLSSRSSSWNSFLEPIKERESKEILVRSHELAVETLHWLFATSPNPKIHSIVVQALGGLLDKPHVEDISKSDELLKNISAVQKLVKNTFNSDELKNIYAVRRLEFYQSTQRTPMDAQTVRPGCEGIVERILRSVLVLPDSSDWYSSLSIGLSKPTLRPAIAERMHTLLRVNSFPSTIGTTPCDVHSRVDLSKVVDSFTNLYPSEWETAFLAIPLADKSAIDPLQVSYFFLLTSSALLSRIPGKSPRAESQVRWSERMDIETFTRTMTSDSFLCGIVQNTIEAFKETGSVLSLLPQSLNMKAHTAMKMVLFALDRLGDRTSTDYVANNAKNLLLLAEALRLLDSILDQHPGSVHAMYVSFPSVCEVLIDRAQLMETEVLDDDSEVLRQKVREHFLGLCETVLRPASGYKQSESDPSASPPSPPLMLIKVISFLVRTGSVYARKPKFDDVPHFFDSDPDTFYQALYIMSLALSSASADASRKFAFDTFVHDDWVDLLFRKVWLVEDALLASSVPLLIDAFTKGLKTYISDTHRNADSYSSYIFQPDKLLLTILMLGIDRDWVREEDHIRIIKRLVSELHPDGGEWNHVLRLLKETLFWKKDSNERFPLNESFAVLTDVYTGRYMDGGNWSMQCERINAASFIQFCIACTPGFTEHIQRIINTIENNIENNRMEEYRGNFVDRST